MAAALTCTESEELIALAALGVLDGAEAIDMETHMRGCAHCRETARAFRKTAATLSESVDLLEPPAALRRRLLGAVYSSAAQAPPRQRRLRSLWHRIPQARVFTVVGAAGVAAALVFAVLATRPVTQPAAAAQVFPITAPAAQPEAHGELTYYPATSKGVLTVSGLPASTAVPGSKVYEVWLITRAGSAQPVAFLSPTPYSGTWTAVVSADISRFQALATTLEPAGGTPEPTGPQVFSVTLNRS